MQCQWPTALPFVVPDGTVWCLENLANQSVLKMNDIPAGKRKKDPKSKPEPRVQLGVFALPAEPGGAAGAVQGAARQRPRHAARGPAREEPLASTHALSWCLWVPPQPFGSSWWLREPSGEQVQPSGSRVWWCACTWSTVKCVRVKLGTHGEYFVTTAIFCWSFWCFIHISFIKLNQEIAFLCK